MRLREAEWCDQRSLAAMLIRQWHDEGFEVTKGAGQRALEHATFLLSSQHAWTAFVEDEDGPFGCVGIVWGPPNPWDGKVVAHLPILWVKPEKRRWSVAIVLYKAARDAAKQRGIGTIFGHVMSDKIRKLDEAVGCRTCGYIVEYKVEA